MTIIKIELMSNYTGWAIHPKTQIVQTAQFLDNYFGIHLYGVKFRNDPVIYPEEEVGIPKDWQVTASEEYKIQKSEALFIKDEKTRSN